MISRMEKIGSKIKEKRKALKLTQKQLGSLVGVSGATVSMWEADTNTPKTENFLSLSKALQVTVDELLENVDMNFIDEETLVALVKKSYSGFSPKHREALMRVLLALDSDPEEP